MSVLTGLGIRLVVVVAVVVVDLSLDPSRRLLGRMMSSCQAAGSGTYNI